MDEGLTEDECQRKALQEEINSSPKTREELEDLFGPDQVWDTDQLRAEFDVHGFAAPFCVVTRKKDGVKGVLAFQHSPRFYFAFAEI